jgi:hypothetical protein
MRLNDVADVDVVAEDAAVVGWIIRPENIDSRVNTGRRLTCNRSDKSYTEATCRSYGSGSRPIQTRIQVRPPGRS